MTRQERERLIQHHLEEASTHIGMVRKLSSPTYTPALDKIGAYLKKLYLNYGGTPH